MFYTQEAFPPLPDAKKSLDSNHYNKLNGKKHSLKKMFGKIKTGAYAITQYIRSTTTTTILLRKYIMFPGKLDYH